MDKYIEATGGLKAHKTIKNRTQNGEFTFTDMGMTANGESYGAPPKFLLVIWTVNLLYGTNFQEQREILLSLTSQNIPALLWGRMALESAACRLLQNLRTIRKSIA